MPKNQSSLVVVLGLWACYTVQAKYTAAHELAEQLLRLAHTAQDALALVGAYWALGETVLFMGRYGPAHITLRQGISHYDSQQHTAQAFVYGQDNGVACLIFEAWALWFLGYPEQALKRGHEGLSLAQEVQHLNTQALAQTCALWLYQFRREVPKVQEMAEGMIRVSTEHGLPQWEAMSTIFHGWALAEQGHVAEGMTQTREGITAWRATGADLGLPYFLALEAEVYLRAGQPEEGLRVLDEALTLSNTTQERVYEAELHRFKGTLMLQSKTSLRQVSDKSRQV
jgi:predicted ATPase